MLRAFWMFLLSDFKAAGGMDFWFRYPQHWDKHFGRTRYETIGL